MDELTFIDVAETPEKLPRPPAGVINPNLLVEIALQGLELFGATAGEVLSCYSEEPILWNLPPRLLPAGKTPIAMTLANTGRAARPLIALHQQCRSLVRHCGMGPRVRHELIRFFGLEAAHPMLFTETEPSEEASNLFSLELILAAASPNSTFFVLGSSVARRFPHKRDDLSSLKIGKSNSQLLTPEWVESRLYSPRGTVLYPTADAFDRCLLWLNRNSNDGYGNNLRAVLSWLKMMQDSELAYNFEQQVRTIQPRLVQVLKVPYGNSIFNIDALNYVRDLWQDTTKDSHEAFRDFYDYLVPTYIDDDRFRKFFKTGMVLKGDFNNEIIKRVDSGMLNFGAWFSKMVEINNG